MTGAESDRGRGRQRNLEPNPGAEGVLNMNTSAVPLAAHHGHEITDEPSLPAVELLGVGVTFETFYSRERDPLVQAVTLVEGSPAVAADLVDEAMARAFQRWSEVSQLQRPGGWVYRVALNLGRSRFRRLGRDLKYRWLMLPESDRDSTVEGAFMGRVENNRLAKAVLSLPEKQRAVIVARVLLDYSEVEVAEILEIQPGTVKSRLSRALASLRQAVPELEPSIARFEPRQTAAGGQPPTTRTRPHHQ